MDSEAHAQTEQYRREQIISQIMNAAEISTIPGSGGIIMVYMEFGSKKLQLNIDLNREGIVGDYNAITIIEKLRKRKLDEETTFLYEAVKRFIQKYTDKSQRNLLYSLQTQNKKMIAFAETKGAQIFGGWDQTLQIQGAPPNPDEVPEQHVFVKQFYPQKNGHE